MLPGGQATCRPAGLRRLTLPLSAVADRSVEATAPLPMATVPTETSLSAATATPEPVACEGSGWVVRRRCKQHLHPAGEQA